MYFVDGNLKDKILLIKNYNNDDIQKIDSLLFDFYKLTVKMNEMFENSIKLDNLKNSKLKMKQSEFIKKFSDYLFNQQELFLNNVLNNQIEQNSLSEKIQIAYYQAKEKMLSFYKEYKIFLITNFEQKLEQTVKVVFNDFHAFENYNKTNTLNLDNNILYAFEVLMISPTKDFKVIKKAYINLCKQFHPDKNKSYYSEQITKNLNKAYNNIKTFLKGL
ncbi:J domain-containing protein [Mesoplasma corruscae]|uniref:J domain-containing protein n=1 Tax=Mesoplasma corruscae TaxID=216874 RepID=A0A2S5RED4_9MOLU|nr:J domain-containing protein [Mesoplasma corruscae]PPE05674.1 hypothetical protein MCORR_v1c07020 [Mesoplasma corruscae]